MLVHHAYITPVVYFMDSDGVGVHTNNCTTTTNANRWTRFDHLARSAANQNTGIASSSPLAQPVITLNVTFCILEEVYFRAVDVARFFAFGSLRRYRSKRKESASSVKVLNKVS